MTTDDSYLKKELERIYKEREVLRDTPSVQLSMPECEMTRDFKNPIELIDSINAIEADTSLQERYKSDYTNDLKIIFRANWPREFEKYNAGHKIIYKDVIEEFIQKFSNYSPDNVLFARALFHVLLGQLLIRYSKTRYVMYTGGGIRDLRVSAMLIQGSRTGKNRGLNFFERVCQKMGIFVNELDSYSAEALIGKYYIPPRNRTTGELTGEERPLYGLIYQNEATSDYTNGEITDIIVLPEASVLIESKSIAYRQDASKYIARALDTIGHNKVKKSMVGTMQYFPPRAPEVFPKCSFVCTSYPPQQAGAFAIGSGLFQRMITIIRSIPLEQTEKNTRAIESKCVGMRMDAKDNDTLNDKDIINIIDTLNDVIEYYKMADCPTMTKDALSLIDNSIHELYKKIKYKGDDNVFADSIRSMTTSMTGMIAVLAAHKSCIRRSDKITVDDVNYAIDLLLEVFNITIPAMEKWMITIERSQPRDSDNVMDRYIVEKLSSSDSGIQRSKLREHMTKRFKMSDSTFDRCMTRLINNKTIHIVKDNKGNKSAIVYLSKNEVKE